MLSWVYTREERESSDLEAVAYTQGGPWGLKHPPPPPKLVNLYRTCAFTGGIDNCMPLPLWFPPYHMATRTVGHAHAK